MAAHEAYCWMPAPAPPVAWLISYVSGHLSNTGRRRRHVRRSSCELASDRMPHEAMRIYEVPTVHIDEKILVDKGGSVNADNTWLTYSETLFMGECGTGRGAPGSGGLCIISNNKYPISVKVNLSLL